MCANPIDSSHSLAYGKLLEPLRSELRKQKKCAAFGSPPAHRRDRHLVLSFDLWGRFRSQSKTSTE